MRKRVALFAGLGGAVASLPRMLFGAWAVILAYTALAVFAAHGVATEPRSVGWIVAQLILMVIQLPLLTALYRVGLGRKAGGLGGLRFGWPELRLYAALLLKGLGFGAVMIIVLLVLLVISKILGPTSFEGLHDPKALLADGRVLLSGALIVLAVLVAVYFYARLALVEAATVARNQVVVGDAFDLTHGSALVIVLGFLVCMVPAVAYGALSSFYVVDGERIAALTRGLIPADWPGPAADTLVFQTLTVMLVSGFLSAAYGQVAPSAKKRPGEFA